MSLLALAGPKLVALLVGILIALLGGAVAYRLAARELRSRVVAAVASLALAAGLLVLPLRISGVTAKVRVGGTRCPQPGAVSGPRGASQVDMLRTLQRQIPLGDTYAVLGASGTLRFCTLSWLLPRILVHDVRSADWLVTFGIEPHSTGVHVAGLRRVGPAVYLGRVEQ